MTLNGVVHYYRGTDASVRHFWKFDALYGLRIVDDIDYTLQEAIEDDIITMSQLRAVRKLEPLFEDIIVHTVASTWTKVYNSSSVVTATCGTDGLVLSTTPGAEQLQEWNIQIPTRIRVANQTQAN